MYILLTVINGSVIQAGSSTASFGLAKEKRGLWAKWQWDGATLRGEVDRYGFYPIFYAKISNGIALSNSISELLRLGASNEFDDSGIAAFLRLGFFIGNDTPFASIRAFPPGGILTWNVMSGLNISGCYIPNTPNYKISRKEAIANFVDSFRAAVRRTLPAEPNLTALPLSGGRDSRHIALELHQWGFKPGMVLSQRHFPTRNDEDSSVAFNLCSALNWPIKVVSQTSDPVLSEIEKNRLFDCLTDEHAWFMPSANTIRQNSIKYIYDGLGGDVLSNVLFCNPEWLEFFKKGDLKSFFGAVSYYGISERAIKAVTLPHTRAMQN